VSEQTRSKRYRTYRGGNVRVDDPDAARFSFGAPPAAPPRQNGAAPPREGLPGRKVATVSPRRTLPIGWKKLVALVLGALLILLVVWLIVGYRAFSSEVAKANARLPAKTKAALTPGGGMLSDPNVTLVLGSDSRGKGTSARADSILLMRTDPGKHTVSMLSIPRDMWVSIPGHGRAKINAAYAYGGTPLLIRTIRAFTGLPINHVVLVDFSGFEDLIDSIGGITINNPTRIVGQGTFDGIHWVFPKGQIHLGGRWALGYARIRHTTNPQDSDISRTERQQRVMQAIAHDLVKPTSLFNLPSIGRAIARPLATDLSANELLEMGWLKFRSQRTVQCHLGGTPQVEDGQDAIVSDPQNRQVVQMYLGKVAPLPAPRGQIYAPGCTVS
jgi:LCP family protein required for cell wall assembly